MIVLLVDDNRNDIEIFGTAIRSIDPEIKLWTAPDSVEALQLLAAEAKQGRGFPSFIFVDINMPSMNGIEFLQILQDEIDCKGTCVTMYTTSSRADEIEKCNRLGADYITKPYDLNDLIHRLSESFKRIGSC